MIWESARRFGKREEEREREVAVVGLKKHFGIRKQLHTQKRERGGFVEAMDVGYCCGG